MMQCCSNIVHHYYYGEVVTGVGVWKKKIKGIEFALSSSSSSFLSYHIIFLGLIILRRDLIKERHQ
jgi:hypothetical protein